MESNIILKCMICKKYLLPSVYGKLLEKYIIKQFKMENSINNISGDAIVKNKNYEIKVSLGNKNGIFNIVQLRPDHMIDYYIILLYNIHENKKNFGKVYILKINSNIMNDIILHHGSYAHGTIIKNGIISKNNFIGKKYEYALRPKYNSILWNKLIKYNIYIYE